MDEKTIFYLAVAAAWGLYNWYVKKNKAQKQAALPKDTPVQATNAKTAEDILAELFNKRQVVEEQPLEAKPEEQPYAYDKEESIEEKYSFDAPALYNELKENERETVAQSYKTYDNGLLGTEAEKAVFAEPVVDEKVDNTIGNEWLNATPEDIRKAFVWAEVLNKPRWAN